MGAIVFVPGILGSELFLGQEMVWPPTVGEVMNGYGRIGKLSDDRVRPGAPIAKVCVKAIYAPLLDDLSAIAGGLGGGPVRRFHPMGYDWRKDIREAAAVIADRIDALPAGDRNELLLVGHSMGCLVLRYILESGDFDGRAWLAKVRAFVAFAGPHRGAPMALVRALGLEGSVGLSGPDIKTLSADPRFPSVYQLLPAPGLIALWKGQEKKIEPLDFYNPAVANALGLARANLDKAKALHDVLGRNRRPAHVAYVQLAGTGHATALRVDQFGDMRVARAGDDAGDGTVPLWSALDPSVPGFAALGAHDSVFTNDQLRNLMFKALGARMPSLGPLEAVADARAIDLSTALVTLPVGQPFDLLLAPHVPVAKIDGAVRIRRLNPETGVPLRTGVRVLPIKVEAAAVTSLRLEIPGLGQPGLYEARFEDADGAAAGRPARFAVSAADQGLTEAAAPRRSKAKPRSRPKARPGVNPRPKARSKPKR